MAFRRSGVQVPSAPYWMIYRKLFHLFSVVLIVPILILDKHWCIITSISILLIIFTVDTLRQRNTGFRKIFMLFFRGILKRDELRAYTGATYLAISYAFLNIMFDKEIVIFSMLILSICDPIAALFGKYIKPTIKIHKKSLNGLIGFYISGAILSVLLFPEISLVSKLLAVIISGIIELFTPIDDNLAIPITSSLILKWTS